MIAARLARWLHVSAPSAAMAAWPLRGDYLIPASAGVIRQTPQGRRIAARLLNRRHLIGRILARAFGREWHRVHDEAEALEHGVSTGFEWRLAEKLARAGVRVVSACGRVPRPAPSQRGRDVHPPPPRPQKASGPDLRSAALQFLLH